MLVLAQHYRRVLTLKYLIHGLTDPMMTSFLLCVLEPRARYFGTRTDHRNYLRVHPTCTGILSHLGAKLRDWAAWQAGAGCYFEAALSPNDSKTR